MLFELKLPLLGFESIKQMKLTKIDDIFMQLENVTNKGKPSFTLIDPFVLKPYEIEIPESVQTLLEINESSNILIYNIVVIQQPLEKSAINFIAPLIFNTDNLTMAQTILDGKSAHGHGMAECICDFMNKDEKKNKKESDHV
ncbi:MAG: flagellar assembly protein FliW [Campylobacterales bacterium]|nr:flagellar assembly protein FliW [Campylobacterales bacterium]